MSQCKAWNERELKRERRKRGRWRTYGVRGPSFLPLPSSPLLPLISPTWDHYSLRNQHPTKTLLSLISSLSPSPIHMLSYLCHFFSLCLFYSLLRLFSCYDILPTWICFSLWLCTSYLLSHVTRHCIKCERVALIIHFYCLCVCQLGSGMEFMLETGSRKFDYFNILLPD